MTCHGMSRDVTQYPRTKGCDIVRHMAVLFLNYLLCFSGPTVLAAWFNNKKKRQKNVQFFLRAAFELVFVLCLLEIIYQWRIQDFFLGGQI
jgi:nucleoside permease NupC